MLMGSSFFLTTLAAAATGVLTLFRKFRIHQEKEDSGSSSPSCSSPPSSLSCKWTHHVFPSFRGEDVRRNFLSHIKKEFKRKGITTFIENEIRRGESIGPELIRAIRGSKIAILLLSRNYASSKWCLDELVEIMKCKKDLGQMVFVIFYEVDPSHVKKLTGEFGAVFEETCKGKTKEDIWRWRQAFKEVPTIAGYDSRNWDNEAVMIEDIVTEISKILISSTPSNDFDDVTAFFVVINLLLEIASTVADQLSSIQKPYLARISLAMSILSVVLSILDLTYKVRSHNARFLCKWPIPWFYYPARGYRRIFGSFTDTVLLFCVVGGFIVSTINYSFLEKGKDGPIKISIWPLFFAIGLFVSKFMEKPVISKDHSL